MSPPRSVAMKTAETVYILVQTTRSADVKMLLTDAKRKLCPQAAQDQNIPLQCQQLQALDAYSNKLSAIQKPWLPIKLIQMFRRWTPKLKDQLQHTWHPIFHKELHRDNEPMIYRDPSGLQFRSSD